MLIAKQHRAYVWGLLNTPKIQATDVVVTAGPIAFVHRSSVAELAEDNLQDYLTTVVDQGRKSFTMGDLSEF